MRAKIVGLSILFLASSCYLAHTFLKKEHALPSEALSYTNFLDNPYLDKKAQTLMAPYLLPMNHPTKPILDSIFSKCRVIENIDTLINAGFSIVAYMQGSFVVVAKHPEVPGYLFKLYLDSEKRTKNEKPHWEWLTKRCIGAENIRRVINEHQISHFTVPDKWIYILPLQPKSKEAQQQPVVLIETDMEIVSPKKIKRAWKQTITPKHLDELYLILKQGYGNTGVLRNIPYTKKGTFAFIDTEYPKKRHDLSHPKKFLSEEMQNYWTLISTVEQ